MSIYKYDINLKYINENEEYVIDSKNIHNLIIDYDYDKNNRPIIFCKVAIDKNILDKMIIDDTNIIYLNIQKYDTTKNFIIKENYINGEFIYFLDDENKNYNKTLDYSNSEKDSTNKFKIITLGLMMKKLIDDNKIVINDIVTNTSLIDIIYKYMCHMNLLIEPIEKKDKISKFIIPPLTSVSDLLKYINKYYNIYNTKYRLFFDHDKTYLLSSNGNKVKSIDDEAYTILLNITNTISINSKNEGGYIDNLSNSYIINIDANDTHVYKDEDSKLSKNVIIGVDNNGNINKSIIDKNDNLDKVKIDRIREDNLNQVDIIRDKLKNSTIINIIKSDLDSSKLTINKEYIIKNYTHLNENDGRYLLLKKKEIYIRDRDYYNMNLLLTLEKIES